MIFLINLVDWLFAFYELLLLIRVLLSWVNPDPYNAVVQFICKMTEPLLGLIRRLIPIRFAMIDFSPIIAFLLLELARRIILQLLVRMF